MTMTAVSILLTSTVDWINISMRVNELLEGEQDLEDWAATASLCKSSRSSASLGASALASCKSQGFRKRSHKRKFKLKAKGPRSSVENKKVKGKKYGGPLPDYGSGSVKSGSR
jgi:hypothetical protein